MIKKALAAVFLAGVLFFACGFAFGRDSVRVVVVVGDEIALDGTYCERSRVFGRKRFVQKLKGEGLTDCEIAARLFENLTEDVRRLETEYNAAAKSAELRFCPNDERIFEYFEEKAGRRLNSDKLYADVLSGVSNSEIVVEGQILEVLPDVTKDDLLSKTAVRGGFSTYYGYSATARKNNIELAAKFIDGTVLKDKEIFSFNRTVGARTAERGFSSAPIIYNGEFVEGVGGGVCQASTTVYNAALYADLHIESASAHSLRVGYVKPSFDAAVTDKTDLVFSNDSGGDVYITAKADGDYLTVRMYGPEKKYEIELESRVLKVIPYGTETVTDEEMPYDEEKILKRGVNGVKSEGYIIKTRGGETTSKTKIRSDVYAPQNEVKAVGTGERSDDARIYCRERRGKTEKSA